MKTKLTSIKVAATACALFLPIAALAQTPGRGNSPSSPDTSRSRTPGATSTDQLRPGHGAPSSVSGSTTGTTAGTPSAMGLWNNPEELFRQLDTDNNGQISKDEFQRISTIRNTPGAPGSGTETPTPSVTPDRSSNKTPDSTGSGTSTPSSGTSASPRQR